MSRSNGGMGSLAAVLVVALAAAAARGAVVTDNNIVSNAFGNLTASGTQVWTNMQVRGNDIRAVAAWVRTTSGATPVNGFYVDAVSTGAPPFTGLQGPLLATHVVNLTGAPYPDSFFSMVFYVPPVSTNVFYRLNLGQGGNPYGWVWEATNITLYGAKGADTNLLGGGGGFGGNLIPNASFEDTNIYFMSGTYVDDTRVQGAKTFQNLSTLDSYIAVPLVPDYRYRYSFWLGYSGFAEYEYGTNFPGNGATIASGNVGSFLNSSTQVWIEFTGSFTAALTQATTYFYFGAAGLSGGTNRFDSFFMQSAPPPAKGTMMYTR